MFNKNKLKASNIIGIGCDNAPAMVGEVGGAVKLLEKEWKKNLIMSRCVCHSMG